MMKDGTYIVKLDIDGKPMLGSPALMSSGYWVADESGVSVHGELDERGLSDAMSLMGASDGDIIGIWENKSLTYIDRAYHIEDKSDAMALAKKQNQLAIWDCELNQAVFL